MAVSGTQRSYKYCTDARFIFNAIMTVIVAAAGFFLVSNARRCCDAPCLMPDPRLARPVKGVLDD